MEAHFRNLPKAELHLHLEGSVEPETMCRIDPGLTPEEVRQRYLYQDFAGFLVSYEWAMRKLTGPRQYALAARGLLGRLEGENVRYAEINLSAGVLLWLGLDFDGIFDAVVREAAASPVKVAWILDGVRQFGVDNVMRVAELAVRCKERGVVGFGIGGDEARGPAELFGEPFALARRNGLRLAPHAGETQGPASVWAALELGAERIGHGIRALEDPVLVRHLADRGIPLEVCISSNVATGVAASLRHHPVRALYDAGVPVTLNTDDPAMFHTTLTREFVLAARELNFTAAELEGIAANAFRFAFRPDAGASSPPRR